MKSSVEMFVVGIHSGAGQALVASELVVFGLTDPVECIATGHCIKLSILIALVLRTNFVFSAWFNLSVRCWSITQSYRLVLICEVIGNAL